MSEDKINEEPRIGVSDGRICDPTAAAG